MAKPNKKPDTAIVKAEPAPVVRGRPTLFTAEIVAEIVFRMSEGATLTQICKDDHMPHRTTVMGWKRENEDFRAVYDDAHKALLEGKADEMLDISDDISNDWVERETKAGRVVEFNKTAVSRAALMIDTRKWLLAKLMQDRFGDKNKTEHSGKVIVEWAVAPVKADAP